MGEGAGYEHIVIGGGSAGCVVAARLAQAGRRVALLEAGPTDLGVEDVADIGRWARLQGSALDYDYAIAPQQRGNSRIRHTRGRVLGGSGSLNTGITFIPPDADFARWVAAGAGGWSAAEVRPAFERALATLETEAARPGNPLGEAFLEAAGEAGLPRVSFADGRSRHGAGRFLFSRRGSRRSSSASAWIHPLLGSESTLSLLTGRRALRLLIEDGHVRGVVTDSGALRAEGELILCCGTFESPLLLMRSGIGPPEALRAAGLRARYALPGVGENLMDHVECCMGWETPGPAPPNELPLWEIGVFARPAGAEPQLMFHMGPTLNDRYVRAAGYASGERGFAVTPNVMYPRSRGHVRPRPGNAEGPPEIDFRYFCDEGSHDERALVAGLRLAREIGRQPALRPWVRRELFPGPALQTDAELGRFARATAGTSYHPAGTCRMGRAEDTQAVVDERLRLRGLAGLRVADASIFPTLPGVNPNLSCLMVGERCAEFILAEG